MLLGREYNCVEMGDTFVGGGGDGKVERLEVKIKGGIKRRERKIEGWGRERNVARWRILIKNIRVICTTRHLS